MKILLLVRSLAFLFLCFSLCLTACAVRPAALPPPSAKTTIPEKSRGLPAKKNSKVVMAPKNIPAGLSTQATTGQALYARHCERCHGKFKKTDLQNFRTSRIRSSFTQFPIMNQLKKLSDADLQKISTELSQRRTTGR